MITNVKKIIITQLFQRYQIQIYAVAAQSHEPNAERNNCVIKEQV